MQIDRSRIATSACRAAARLDGQGGHDGIDRIVRPGVGPGWACGTVPSPRSVGSGCLRRRPPDAPSRQAGGRRHPPSGVHLPRRLGTLRDMLVIAIVSSLPMLALGLVSNSAADFSIQLSIQVMSWRLCSGRTCRSMRLSIGPSGRRLVSIVPPRANPISRSCALANPPPCPLGELEILVGWMWNPATPTAAPAVRTRLATRPP